MATDVTLAVHAGIALITIDRPATRNAVDRPTIAALSRLLDDVERRVDLDEVRVLGIRGGGDRVFISGGDLKELAGIRTEDDARRMAASMREVLDRVARLSVPTVALLNGHALGGGAEIAVACDLRLAASDVRIGFTQVQLGITPAWGGIERLTTLIGRGRALHLLLTGSTVEAAEARSVGLVEQVADRPDFDAAAGRLLEQLAAVPHTASAGIRDLVNQVRPPDSPETAARAIASFAASWVADEHWSAVDRQTQLRQARRDGEARTAGSATRG